MNSEKNYQKSSVKIKKCKNCQKNCTLIYDHHHDQHFSKTCGTVIFQSLDYLLEYRTDPYYWEKEYQRRREKKEIQKEKETIQKKLIEYKKTYEITDNNIHILDLKITEERKIINLCKDTHFKLIRKNITHNGELKETQYIITQKKPEEIKRMKKEKHKKEKNKPYKKI